MYDQWCRHKVIYAICADAHTIYAIPSLVSLQRGRSLTVAVKYLEGFPGDGGSD